MGVFVSTDATCACVPRCLVRAPLRLALLGCVLGVHEASLPVAGTKLFSIPNTPVDIGTLKNDLNDLWYMMYEPPFLNVLGQHNKHSPGRAEVTDVWHRVKELARTIDSDDTSDGRKESLQKLARQISDLPTLFKNEATNIQVTKLKEVANKLTSFAKDTQQNGETSALNNL